MNKNVGTTDKIIRIAIGFALLAAGFLLSVGSVVQIVLFVAAAIAFTTALVSFCPLYRLLGLSTSKNS